MWHNEYWLMFLQDEKKTVFIMNRRSEWKKLQYNASIIVVQKKKCTNQLMI